MCRCQFVPIFDPGHGLFLVHLKNTVSKNKYCKFIVVSSTANRFLKLSKDDGVRGENPLRLNNQHKGLALKPGAKIKGGKRRSKDSKSFRSRAFEKEMIEILL